MPVATLRADGLDCTHPRRIGWMDMERLREPALSPLHAAAPRLADAVVPQVSRALALLDQNPASPTYGCADRAFWYYRTLTNFPGSTWQQLMLALACLYRTGHPSNPYCGDARIAELVGAALSFWAGAQQRDGAFDEWYLNEHSYCPTAITGAGAALTLHLMGDDLSPEARARGLGALERACAWLERRYNPEVMNQNLAAAAALQGLAMLQPGSRWGEVARVKLERVAREQSREGWFSEYGGMDFGYSTLALDLLGACHVLGAGALAAEMASRLCRFLVDVRGVGLGVPGRLGSRGTSHGFPFGALCFASIDPRAARLAQRFVDGISAGVIAAPGGVDDRYFAYFYLPQFALAYHRASEELGLATPAAEGAGASRFAESGINLLRRPGWSVTVNTRMGGALALETPAGVHGYHLGYEVSTQDGRRFSSATLQPARSVPSDESESITALAEFRAVSGGLPLRRLMVPFQAVLYLLRSSYLAGMFQSLIKRRMIAPKTPLALVLERRVEAGSDCLVVLDRLVPGAAMPPIVSVRCATTVSMHSPSARQDPGEAVRCDEARLVEACARLNLGRAVSLRWTLKPGAVQGAVELIEEKQ